VNNIKLVNDISSYNCSDIFAVKMYAMGHVQCVGPNISEIVTGLAAFDKWKQGIQENFKENPGPVTSEIERLRRAVWDSEDKVLNACLTPICFDHISTVRFSTSGLPLYSSCEHHLGMGDGGAKSEPMDGKWNLYRLCGSGFLASPWNIGVAPASTRPGDLICWVSGISRCVVVRIYVDSDFGETGQIVGLAAVSDHVVSRGGEPVVRWPFNLRPVSYKIKLDARTMFVLLSSLSINRKSI